MTKSKGVALAQKKRRGRILVLAEKRRENRLRRSRERNELSLKETEALISGTRYAITALQRDLTAAKKELKRLELRRAVLRDRLK